MERKSFNGSGFLTFYQQLATENPCYKENGNRKETTHIILHSTGANNPNLKRYVTPDDGFLGHNPYTNGWNKPDADTLVHAVIGKNKSGVVEAYQIAPWAKLVWGCGSGPNGSGNSFAIHIEICEDKTLGAPYVKQTYDVAVKLIAHLCKVYKIDTENIWSHKEANAKGFASAHMDPEHWWNKVESGYSMDTLRKAVKSLLGEEKNEEQTTSKNGCSSIRETSGNSWKVQAGAFQHKQNAIAQAEALKAARYDTFLVPFNGWWKVQVGAFSKREYAEKFVAKLAADGFNAIIVKA